MPARRFLSWPGPIPFAHRGGALDQPENTLPAFAAAVELGYRHLETDVHLSADGVVFAFHDDSLDRTTDRTGRIDALSAAEVEAADAGYSFSPDGAAHPCRGRGVVVPRLEHILETWPQVLVNIDPKQDAVVEPLLDLLGRMDAWDRVCIGAFSDARLRRVRTLAQGRVCTSMGPWAVGVARCLGWVGLVPRLGADCLQLPVRGGGVRLVTPRLVGAAHRRGLQVHVWTVDDPAEMEALLEIGVDGLMTDRPRVLREVLLRRGAWHGG